MSSIIPYDPNNPPNLVAEKEPTPSQSIRDAYYVIFRHKTKILLFTGAVVLAVLATIVASPPRYLSEADIFVKPVTSDSSGEGSDWARAYRAESAILRSRDVAREAARALGIGEFAHLDEATDDLQQRLTVHTSNEDSMIHLTCEAHSAQQAHGILGQFVRTYLERHRDIHRAPGSPVPNQEQAAADAGATERVAVIQAATTPSQPMPSPNRFLKLLLALLGGLLGGMTLAFVVELLDTSLKTPDNVKDSLGASTFSSIPRMDTGELKPRVVSSGPSGGLLERNFNSRATEHFDQLRDRVLLSLNGSVKRPVVLGVTSCVPGEGVTTVACNLAANLARNGNERVLLIDSNLDHPTAHEVLGVEPDHALSVSGGNGSGKTEPVEENLFLLPAEPSNGNGTSNALTKKFESILQLVDEHQYDFVIIDLPSLGERAATARVAGQVDGVIFVTEAERVRSQVARQARNLLLEAHANVLGVVLNKRRFYVPDWLYERM